MTQDKLDIEKVRQIARLAQLELSAAEEESLVAQLNGILSYFKMLDSIDTTAVEAMSHSLSLSNAFAADTPEPGLSPEKALANAPDRDDDQVRVPAIIE